MLLNNVAAGLRGQLFPSQRGYATLKDIQTRLKAIKNIGKITSSMKMIASTKLNRAQKAMEVGREYGQASVAALKYFGDGMIPETKGEDLLTGVAAVPKTQSGKKNLVLTCSSDRGLCGAIHSSVAKLTRFLAKSDPAGTMVAVLGDKAKPQVARDAKRSIVISFAGVGRNIPVMQDAITILEQLKASGIKSDSISLIYNRFQSVIAFQSTLVQMPSMAQLKAAPKITAYEVSDEVLENYSGFLLASRLYWALVEGHAAEMAAKRTAMENASKNAEEISLSLLMKYNRTRQAVITNELVDIITGASAL